MKRIISYCKSLWIFGLFGILVACIQGCSVLYDSASLENSFLLEINQVALPEGKPQTFVLKSQQIFIYQSQYDEQHQLIKELVYKQMLDDMAYKNIVNLCNNLFQLDSIYTKASLDGLIWEVTLFSGEKYKTIHVENVLPDNITTVFKNINLLIPNKKPKIMLGWE